MNKLKHNSIVKEVPMGFRKLPDGGQNKIDYISYCTGSLFYPDKYGEYIVVYVKDKRWE